jgi:outer membrane protein assembly factor BamB
LSWKHRAGVTALTLLFESIFVVVGGLAAITYLLVAWREGWIGAIERHWRPVFSLTSGAASLIALALFAAAVRIVRFVGRNGGNLSTGGAVGGTFLGLMPGGAGVLTLRFLDASFANGELHDFADWYLLPSHHRTVLYAAIACTAVCVSVGAFVGSGSRWQPAPRSLLVGVACLTAAMATVPLPLVRLLDRTAVSRIVLPTPLRPSPVPIWSRRVTAAQLGPSGQLEGSPTSALVRGPGGRLYFSANGVLAAVDTQGGLIWEFRPPSFNPKIGPPVLSPQGLVVVGTSEGLIALDRDGEPAWRVQPDERATAVGTWKDILYAVFAKAGRNRLALRALDADTGNERWSVDAPTETVSVALDGAGRLYLSSDGLRVFDDAGRPVWQYPAQGRVNLATDGSVYLSSRTGLTALTSDGKLAWRYSSFTPCADSGMAVTGDALYCASGGRLFSFGRNGRERWHRRVEGSLWPNLGAPVVSPGGTVYLAGQSLWAIKADGRVEWRVRLVSELRPGRAPRWPPSAPPALAPDKTIWIGCTDGRVLVIDRGGRLLWEYRPGAEDPLPTPVTGFFWLGGTVIVESGTLRAFPLS